MNYNDIVTLISSVGFPIVVSGYCLITLNQTMMKMTDAINNLSNYIKKEGDSNAK